MARCPRTISGFAVNLGPPPAHADEQETPVAEKLRRFALEGVADELENPSQNKESERVGPEAMEENAAGKNRDREQDGRNAQSMAGAVHAILMAGGVLRDPLLAAAVA